MYKFWQKTQQSAESQSVASSKKMHFSVNDGKVDADKLTFLMKRR